MDNFKRTTVGKKLVHKAMVESKLRRITRPRLNIKKTRYTKKLG